MDESRQVSTVLIDSIKPDPNQPRKTFTDKHIEELSKNLTTIGLINPIETDENLMIITGECRWRAAKKAGWTEIPIIINTQPLTSYERLRRQLSENILQSGADKSEMMNPIDTAKALARLAILKSYNVVRQANGQKEESSSDVLSFKDETRLYQAISAYSNRELSEVYHSIPVDAKNGLVQEIITETGIKRTTIWELLGLLDQPEFVVTDIEAGRPRTYYREAEKAAEASKGQIKEKISKGHYKSRDEVSQDVEVSKRTPDLAVIELEREKAKESTETNRILNSVVRLGLALDSISLDQIDERERQIVIKQLQWIHDEIEKYLAEPKVLEGEVA